MSLTFYSLVLFVSNIERAKKFYSEVMGQEIEYDFGNNILFKSRLSLWQIDDRHEISKIASKTGAGNSFELYFETDNIQDSCKQIKAAGMKLLHDVKTESWGQMTLRFFDPDGHLIEIGEEMDSFILRNYNETLSVEETSAKTGIPLKVIRETIDSEKNDSRNQKTG